MTENEGGLLALIHRKGPLSAYQVAKAYESSPLFTINTAKGKLYPLLDRLTAQGLLVSEDVPNDRRGTKLYSCTSKGREELGTWVRSFRREHELPPDPLRRKLQALDLLSRDEQRAWVETARRRLNQRLEAVEAFEVAQDGPYGSSAQRNARESLLGRLRWLDDLALMLR